MDKFLSYKNFLKNKKKLISKKKKFAVITGGCGRIGSVFIGQLLYNGYKVICLSKTEKKCLEYKKTLPTNLKKNLIRENTRAYFYKILIPDIKQCILMPSKITIRNVLE